MSSFKFTFDWQATGCDAPEVRETTGQLSISIDGLNLTQNEDIWSETIRDSVLVSAYPLAMWLASSWWRLNYEPLPKTGLIPSLDWRMGHEIGAANHGYVWPKIILASDSESMQIWAAASNPSQKQSVRYLNGLPIPKSVPLSDFKQETDRFINTVLKRLDLMGLPNSDLQNLWNLIREDRVNPLQATQRRLEAQMGYDPEECPDQLITMAIELEKWMGTATLSELAPLYGKQDQNSDARLDEITQLAKVEGLLGKPAISIPLSNIPSAAPWERAVDAARALRLNIGNPHSPLNDTTLYELLGLNASAVDKWSPPQTKRQRQAGLAVPQSNGNLNFISRKLHPSSRRFEFARFLGDYLSNGTDPEQWLTSTDLATSRQKYQRAFAAELLCPINALIDFLDNDFSESAIEDAADRFKISERAVESLLVNNSYIAAQYTSGDNLPYRLASA